MHYSPTRHALFRRFIAANIKATRTKNAGIVNSIPNAMLTIRSMTKFGTNFARLIDCSWPLGSAKTHLAEPALVL